MTKSLEAYQAYRDKIGDRLPLYGLIADTYGIRSALYPGSHIDIGPSFVIPQVIYVDNFRGAIKFFKDIEEILAFVEQHKKYDQPTQISFFGQSYQDPLELSKVDLLISQYAGFVGQYTKGYLKPGGLLLCNDSHGDASLAYLDEDFDLIGVVHNLKIITNHLDQYFKRPKDAAIDEERIRKEMKGPKYIQSAENYLFRYIKDHQGE